MLKLIDIDIKLIFNLLFREKSLYNIYNRKMIVRESRLSMNNIYKMILITPNLSI